MDSGHGVGRGSKGRGGWGLVGVGWLTVVSMSHVLHLKSVHTDNNNFVVYD